MSRYRKRNSLQNTLKDYIVPIIWWVLILLILYSFLRWDNSSGDLLPATNATPIDISFKTSSTESIISYPGNKKESINDDEGLYKWETLSVKEGIVELSLINGSQIALNKIAELKYNNDESFSFYSSDAWFDVTEKMHISMRYADVYANSQSIVSLTQNEAGSTIYVLRGSAKVENLWWVSTQLSAGQKISISAQNAAKKDIDLSIEKTNIDTYFKESDWYIENEGYLISSQTSLQSEDTSSWESISSYIELENIEDEIQLSSSSINIAGRITTPTNLWAISFNNIDASINQNEKTFILEDFPLSGNVHDLVIKIFDEEKNILEKSIITLYTNAKIQDSSTTSSASQWVTTYSVDANQFGFTAPSVTGKFTTSGQEITIRWITTAENISSVQVNGFTLKSFNGSTWRYHAFTRFDNLQEWTNQYKIDYFGEDGEKVYTDYYTIVKQTAPTRSETPPPALPVQEETPPALETVPEEIIPEKEKLISDEA